MLHGPSLAYSQMEIMETHVSASGDSTAPESEGREDQNESALWSSSEGADVMGGDGEIGADENDDNTNAGWAEAMAKILKKKSGATKGSILVKNKELSKIKARERQEQEKRKKQADKKQAWEMMFREKPDIVKDRETERALQRIATRGVVQLFNAVKKHQKSVKEEVKGAGGSERKKAKILSSISKRDFIDVLRGTGGGTRVPRKTEKDAAADVDPPAWSVLRDDFMMGATMKDWDKDSDREKAEEGVGNFD
ncbi:RRP15-like protein [Pholidichthys leucotaenia]